VPFSFERWDDRVQEEHNPQAFPFSEDLRELEASLAMGFQEGMANFQAAEPPPSGTETAEAYPAVPDEARWDELARVVADHVLTYMQEADNPLRSELERQRRAADEYYRDNKAMAEQIRQLIIERERLTQALQAFEMESARYRHVLGNLYLKL
jgi:hypothetical protein